MDFDIDIPNFVKARKYAVGRHEPVSLVVIHTTETDCGDLAARNVAAYFASPKAPDASSHYIVGPSELIQCVPESDTAWAAPGANERGIQIEHTARAMFNAEQWASPDVEAMIQLSAILTARVCARYQIPIVRLDAADVLAGKAGITGHVDVSRAFGKSSHYDPGVLFPWDHYLTLVRFALV